MFLITFLMALGLITNFGDFNSLLISNLLVLFLLFLITNLLVWGLLLFTFSNTILSVLFLITFLMESGLFNDLSGLFLIYYFIQMFKLDNLSN